MMAGRVELEFMCKEEESSARFLNLHPFKQNKESSGSVPLRRVITTLTHHHLHHHHLHHLHHQLLLHELSCPEGAV